MILNKINFKGILFFTTFLSTLNKKFMWNRESNNNKKGNKTSLVIPFCIKFLHVISIYHNIARIPKEQAKNAYMYIHNINIIF